MSFVRGPVTVTVPATSANLGPGFDSLGLALELRDELSATVTREGLHVEVSGEAADVVPRGEDHLVVRAMRAAFAELGVSPPGLELVCTNAIPHARGLGSSAAAIVAGVHLARALVEGGRSRLGDHAAFQLAASIEGHPDNVAAASFGGLTIAWTEDGMSFAAPSQVAPGVRTVAFVPPTALSTEVARGLLPASVAHADAAASAGRAALLVAAMATGWTAKLLPATRDWLHQEYRRPPCRSRWRWSTRCAPPGTRRSSRARARRCWCSPPGAPTSRRTPRPAGPTGRSTRRGPRRPRVT